MVAAMQRLPQPIRDVFVVRIWRNPQDRTWRGEIIHVATGETIAFGNDRDLLAYIRHRLDIPPRTPGRSGLR